ncbi:hypothetical protein GCM10011519_15140 [Marmoricola endophyticus]|uniref:DUF4232 domain-containing protein n=2 Tax=Marmoricola endophyticus TaxID=2040280 RepID=A0A917F3Q4_9ACTN|nr:hypothetical protein GCM10011519_15140 [Marmoricola endophyticus]
MAHRTPARRVRAASCAVLVAGLGVTLAGCGNGVESSTGTAPATTVSVTPTPTPATSPSQSASAEPSGSTSGDSSSGGSGSSSGGSSGSPSGSSGTSICSAGDLKVSESSPAGNGGGTAGSVYTELTFANTSSSTCVLDGHPGVSFVGNGSGTQLGRGATFIGPTKRTTLAPGSQARAQLRIASPGVYGDSCAPVAADGFRIYPPDSRASVFVRESSFRACSKKLPGGKSQLSVTAVGTVQ